MKHCGFEFPCSRPISTALLEVVPFTIDMAFDGMDCTLYRINASRRSLARKRWISRSCAKASLFWCSPTSEQKNCLDRSLDIWAADVMWRLVWPSTLGVWKAEEAKKQFRRASQFFVNTRDTWPDGTHPLHMLQMRCLCTIVHTCSIRSYTIAYAHMDVGQNGRPRGPQMLV